MHALVETPWCWMSSPHDNAEEGCQRCGCGSKRRISSGCMNKNYCIPQDGDANAGCASAACLQNGLMEAPANKSRKQIKERKNRTKKLRGAKKNATVACREEVGCSSCGCQLSEGNFLEAWACGRLWRVPVCVCRQVVHAADACRNEVATRCCMR